MYRKVLSRGKRGRPETTTAKVERVLREADDMLTPAVLVARTGSSTNQVNTALHSLHHYKVVDFIANDDGKRTHWFALPKELDQRIRTVEERTPEDEGSRKRRKPRKEK